MHMHSRRCGVATSELELDGHARVGTARAGIFLGTNPTRFYPGECVYCIFLLVLSRNPLFLCQCSILQNHLFIRPDIVEYAVRGVLSLLHPRSFTPVDYRKPAESPSNFSPREVLPRMDPCRSLDLSH